MATLAALTLELQAQQAIAEAQRLEAALDNINRVSATTVQNMNTQFGTLGTQFQSAGATITSGFNNIATGITGVSTKIQGALFSLQGVMVAVLGGDLIRRAINEYAAFDQALVGVGKTTDIEGAALEQFGERIREMTRTMPFAATELLNIAQIAGQLGVEGEENLLKFTDTVAKLGTASDLAGEEAAFALSRIISLSAATVDEVDLVASALVHLGNNVAATESEIANMAVRVGQSTKAFELQADFILGVSAAMVELGIRAESGGTQIGLAMTTMASAVAAGGDELQAFADVANMSVQAFEALFRSNPEEAFLAIVEGLSRVRAEDPIKLVETLDEIGFSGLRMGQVFQSLSGDWERFAEVMGLSREGISSTNALMEEFNRFVEGAESQLKLFQNAISDALITLGGALIPAVNSIREQITAGLDSSAFEDFARSVGDFALVIADNIGLISKAFGTLIALKVGTFFASLVPDLLRIKDGIVEVATGFTMLASSGGGLAALRTALAFLTGPTGLVLLAAGAIATLIGRETEMESASDAAADAIDALRDAMANSQGAAEIAADEMARLRDEALLAAEASLEAAESAGAFEVLAAAARQFVEGFAQRDITIGQIIVDSIRGALPDVTSAFDDIEMENNATVQFIMDVWGGLQSFFAGLWASIPEMPEWMRTAGGVIADPIGAIRDQFAGDEELQLLNVRLETMETNAREAAAALNAMDDAAQIDFFGEDEDVLIFTRMLAANMAEVTEEQKELTEETDKQADAFSKLIDEYRDGLGVTQDNVAANLALVESFAGSTAEMDAHAEAIEVRARVLQLEAEALEEGVTLTDERRASIQALAEAELEWAQRLEATNAVLEFQRDLLERQEELDIQLANPELTERQIEDLIGLTEAVENYAIAIGSEVEPGTGFKSFSDQIEEFAENAAAAQAKIQVDELKVALNELGNVQALELEALQFEVSIAGLSETERNAWMATLEFIHDQNLSIRDLTEEQLQNIFQQNLAWEQQTEELREILETLDMFEDAGREVGSNLADGIREAIKTGDFGTALKDAFKDVGTTVLDLGFDILVRDPLEDFFGDLFREIGSTIFGLETDEVQPVFVTNWEDEMRGSAGDDTLEQEGFFSRIFGAVRDGFMWVVDQFRAVFGPLLSGLDQILGGFLSNFWELLTALFRNVGELFSGSGGGGLLSGVGDFFTETLGLGDIAGQIGGFFTDTLGLGELGSAAMSLLPDMSSLTSFLPSVEGMSSFLTNISPWMTAWNAASALIPALPNPLELVSNIPLIGDAFDFIGSGFGLINQQPSNFGQGVTLTPRDTLMEFGGTGDKFNQEVRDAVDAVGQNLQGFVEGLEEILDINIREKIAVELGARDPSRILVGPGNIFESDQTLRGPVGDPAAAMEIAMAELVKTLDLAPAERRILEGLIEQHGANIEAILTAFAEEVGEKAAIAAEEAAREAARRSLTGKLTTIGEAQEIGERIDFEELTDISLTDLALALQAGTMRDVSQLEGLTGIERNIIGHLLKESEGDVGAIITGFGGALQAFEDVSERVEELSNVPLDDLVNALRRGDFQEVAGLEGIRPVERRILRELMAEHGNNVLAILADFVTGLETFEGLSREEQQELMRSLAAAPAQETEARQAAREQLTAPARETEAEAATSPDRDDLIGRHLGRDDLIGGLSLQDLTAALETEQFREVAGLEGIRPIERRLLRELMAEHGTDIESILTAFASGLETFESLSREDQQELFRSLAPPSEGGTPVLEALSLVGEPQQAPPEPAAAPDADTEAQRAAREPAGASGEDVEQALNDSEVLKFGDPVEIRDAAPVHIVGVFGCIPVDICNIDELAAAVGAVMGGGGGVEETRGLVMLPAGASEEEILAEFERVHGPIPEGAETEINTLGTIGGGEASLTPGDTESIQFDPEPSEDGLTPMESFELRRQEFQDRVNELFGSNISVSSFHSGLAPNEFLGVLERTEAIIPTVGGAIPARRLHDGMVAELPGGRTIPISESGGRGGRGAGGDVHLHFHGIARDAKTGMTPDQIRDEIMPHVRDAQRNRAT